MTEKQSNVDPALSRGLGEGLVNRRAKMREIQFSADASLIAELGEKLIGRSSIAVGELVKNAYDADASICRIEIGADRIVISDDGSGMSENDFLQYWMRIGTTHKIDERTSKGGRAMTGSKGIGRLSVQFLADEMELDSASANEPGKSLYAFVDWTAAKRGKDLNTVNVLWDTPKNIPAFPSGSRTGARITLSKLKSQWDADTIEDLGDAVWSLRSPFKRSRGARNRGPEEFSIELDAPGIPGAQEAFDKKLDAVFSNWKARIRGTLDGGRSGGRGTVTVEFKAAYPKGSKKAELFRAAVPLPIRPSQKKPLIDRASFEILIFKPEGHQSGNISVGDLRKYLARFGNVSVYDAGFRLPYYGSGRDPTGQDWLVIALDQGRRLNASELLPENLRTQNKYMQDLPAPGRIFGAVEIDTNHERVIAEKVRAKPGEWLQISSGRDRLNGNTAFAQLHDFVRFSLDFYANRFRLLDLQVAEEKREKEPPSKKYDRVVKVLEANKEEIPATVYRQVRREVKGALEASKKEEGATDRRAVLLAPLASAGMVALALNHEIARESRVLDRIGSQLRRIAKKHGIEEIGVIADEFHQAKRRLDSLRELFAPLISDADKSATDRLRVRAVVEQVVSSMRVLMPGVKFDPSGIPADLRFPLGSLAEWNALLQNVLANAWNALLDSTKAEVSFRGSRGRGKEWLHISDTGQGLDIPLSETPKLFESFERRLKISDDKRSIAIGGQGLGLAIVRMIARRRSANVAFVSPEGGFSTTFEVSWRGARK